MSGHDEGNEPAPAVVLGRRVGPFAGRLDAELLGRYAAATRDPSPAVQAGLAVPATAIVTQIWEAQEGARPLLVAADLQEAAASGVHGEHDIVLHRPVEPGEALQIWVDAHGARPAGRNVAVTLHYTAVDAAHAVVAEQWWTTVFLGVTREAVGARAPEHAFPDHARERPVGTYEIDVDPGMATRYAEASGDWSGHHFDVEVARRSGYERTFLHGLCTMALATQGLVSLVAQGDPGRVRRVAVRFASPTFIGELLRVHAFAAGPRTYAFEAEAGGATVISHGRLELR